MILSGLGTKYPIICSPMNGVSDVKLAVACHNAGILPGIVPTESRIVFEDMLSEYKDLTNNGDILVAWDSTLLKHKNIFEFCKKYNVSFIEILDYNPTNMREVFQKSIEAKEYGITLYPKITKGFEHISNSLDEVGPFSTILVKGPLGAGRGVDHVDLEETIIQTRNKYPNVNLIASGGISTSQDIKRIISLGATAVSLGTIFCASLESSMSEEAKLKVINGTYKDVKTLKTGAMQKALIFSEVANDDYNNTAGIIQGAKTGNSGHIFIGAGIDQVTEIKPVQQIVDELVKDL